AGGLDQVLLGDLGAEIAIVGRPVDADDGERDVVPDARGRFRREQVAPGSLEEFQHPPAFKGGRGSEANHHLLARHGLCEPLAADAGDAGLGRAGGGLVAALAQHGDGLRADEAGAADNDDLHGLPSLVDESMKPDRLLSDSRVVDLSMASTPTFVMLSSLKPLFVNSLK